VNPRRVGAVVRRIVNQFRRDHRTLGLLFVAPVAIMLLLGWVIRGQEADATRVVIANEAGTNGARVVAALQLAAGAGDELDVVAEADSEAAGRQSLEDGEADLLVVVTDGGGVIRLVTLGLNPGDDATHISRLSSAFADAVAGLLPPGFGAIPTIERATVHGQPDADVMDAFAPVFVGYFAYFFVFILTGISFLRERMGGTLERLLATPVTRAEIVIGYSLGFGLFATLQVAVLTAFVLMAVDVPAIGPIPAFTIGLGVDSAGSPMLAFALALLLSLGAVNLGIFLSTFARNEFQILQFIPLVIIPQGLLGGIFWPIDKLPEILAPIARLLPMTYAVDGLREVMLKGADLSSGAVQVDLAVLAGIALFFVVVAAATIKREVA
jgi:ABC-2 type transport system permease protein